MTQDTWQDMRSQLTLMTITSHTNVINSRVRISTTTHPLKWCNYFTYKVVLFITPWVLDILWARSTWNASLDLRNMTVVNRHTQKSAFSNQLVTWVMVPSMLWVVSSQEISSEFDILWDFVQNLVQKSWWVSSSILLVRDAVTECTILWRQAKI